MRKKPGLGWLYMFIALCLMFSGVMTWGLLRKLAQQDESAKLYQGLSDEAVVTGITAFPDVTVEPTEEAPFEGEAEDQSDTVFFINHDVAVITATPPPSTLATLPGPSATPAPARTPAYVTVPTVAPVASAALATPSGALATQTPSAWFVLNTDKPAASPTQTSSAKIVSHGVVSLGGTAKPTVTQTVAPGTVAAGATPRPTGIAATASPTPAASGATVTPTAFATDVPGLSRVVTMDDVHYSVDFGYLQTINQDVKAWLVQDGTAINYPVLQGKNNDYYLERLFNGKTNKDGSIFLDSGSSAVFDDANTYIYGHHTKTDSMFSTLAKYRNQAYYDAHPQIVLLTPYGDYCVDFFAARVCAVDDETSWRVKQFLRKADFTSYLRELASESLFTAKPESMPEWGDQMLVLVTCTNDAHGERYVLYGRMRTIAYASADKVTVTKLAMDAAPTLGGWQDVPGRGRMMVYAQNDPLWTRMRYESRESNKRRTFGAGGCGPTSVAMAVVNLVPEARLADIYGYAKTSLGYTFCECSVNQYFCNKLHAQYQIQTPEEYLRYYPLVMANFATGNNLWGQVSRGKNAGTALNFIKKVAYLYKLDLSVTYDNNEALSAVKNGAMVVASLGGQNPFTASGHYIVLASVDDTYAYLLDPYRQENYDKADRQHILTTLAPGVVRVKLEDVPRLFMSTCYVLKATDATASPEPPAVK